MTTVRSIGRLGRGFGDACRTDCRPGDEFCTPCPGTGGGGGMTLTLPPITSQILRTATPLIAMPAVITPTPPGQQAITGVCPNGTVQPMSQACSDGSMPMAMQVCPDGSQVPVGSACSPLPSDSAPWYRQCALPQWEDHGFEAGGGCTITKGGLALAGAGTAAGIGLLFFFLRRRKSS